MPQPMSAENAEISQKKCDTQHNQHQCAGGNSARAPVLASRIDGTGGMGGTGGGPYPGTNSPGARPTVPTGGVPELGDSGTDLKCSGCRDIGPRDCRRQSFWHRTNERRR